MSRATTIVLALIAAFAAGTASAGYAISSWLELAGQRSGPWQRLSTMGQINPDPYTQAFEHMSTQLPIGNAEGHIYIASTDSDGVILNASCNYVIDGDIPAARLFTIHIETPERQLIKSNPPLQSALHSDQILYTGMRFTINIGATAQPDNWLALEASGPFRLVITYYDVAVINDDTGNSTRLPDIIRGSCANA
jgi:hypothetical protein